jgi:hypothetical protein
MKICILLVCLSSILFADTSSINDIMKSISDNRPTITATTKVTHVGITEPEFRLRLLYCIFVTVPVILCIILFFVYRKKDSTTEDLIHATGLVFVIYATLMVVLATVNSEALTAAIGIIGAVAGYIFRGSTNKSKEPDTNVK